MWDPFTAVPILKSNTVRIGLLIFIPLAVYFFSVETIDLNPWQSKVSVDAGATINDVPANEIFFVGDIMLARSVNTRMNANPQYPFQRLEKFPESTIAVGNFEATVPETHQHTPNGGMVFSVPESHLAPLAEVGFDVMGLANNHSQDYGSAGFSHTKESLSQSGLLPFGLYSGVASSSVARVSLEEGVVAILFLNALWPVSVSDIENLLAEETAEDDFVVAYVHWGEEYVRNHNSAQADLARNLVASGVDAIIGHHPHVVQDIVMVDDVPVFYSLGNFIFDQYFSVDVQQGLGIRFRLTPDTAQFHLLPYTSMNMPSAPALMEENEATAFLHNLANLPLRSQPDLRDQIRSGVITIDR